MPAFSRLLLLLAASLLLAACQHGPRKTSLYQYSTLAALMAGNYEGQATVGELAAKGDFGLGTFNGLDGEMVVLDGTFRRADSGLRLNAVASATHVPFASLVFFVPQGQTRLPALPDLAALSSWLDAQLASPRLFAAAKVHGAFARLTIRSVPAFSPPYPGLLDALKSQAVRELTDASGTLVGIRAPAETSGTAVPGWHFHFVSDDGTTGGHVLAATPAELQAAWMSMDRMVLDMPATGAAGTAAEIPGETVGGAAKQ